MRIIQPHSRRNEGGEVFVKINSIKWIVAILLVIAGISSLMYVYFSVYSPTVEENEKLEKNIKLSEQTYANLSYYHANEDMFKKETDSLKGKVEQILSVFPVEIKTEDELIYANYLEEKFGYHISSLNIGADYSLYTMSSGHTLCSQYITVPYKTDYEGFKKLVTFFNGDNKTGTDYPASIVTISVSLADNSISGSMLLRRYYVVGQNAEYLPPVIPEGMFDIGVDNIFG